jgi:cytochrome c biogenesis factor
MKLSFFERGYFVVGIFLLASTLLFFVLSFLFFTYPHKKVVPENFRNLIFGIPLLLNLLTYGYFAYLFLSHQFQFSYVYQNSNLSMPTGLLLSSSWSGQAGSLFLWSFFCCLTLLIAYLNVEWKKLVVPILLFHQIVLLILVWNAKPFAKSVMLFTDGLGMNPALSHILMIIHPPFAFLGYSFLALLFAYSIASLINQKFTKWLVQAKKFALIALISLSTTTVLGSLWAYQVVGWGGYWSFDPIENGTLITCLLLLAFIHALSFYQKQKTGLKLLYFLSILVYSSVIHMVLLIRSGLLKNLTQHSYNGPGLLYALAMTDILTFVVPTLLLIVQSKKMESNDPKISLISKSGRNRVLIWLLIIMSSILFADLNQPLLAPYLSLSQTQFSPLFRSLFFVFTLLAYILFIISSSLLAHKRSVRIHTWGKFLIELLLSSLPALLAIKLLGMELTRKSIPVFLLLLIPVMGIFSVIKTIKKQQWFSISHELSHFAVCLLLASIFLTNAYNKKETVCLEKDVPYVSSQYSITLQKTIKKIPEFVGEKEEYALDFSKGPFHFTVYPSIWTFNRNQGPQKQMIPYVQILPDTDIIVVPKQIGRKTFLLNKETNLNGLIITLKEYSKTTTLQSKTIETVVINIKQVNDEKKKDLSLQKEEDFTLSRRITKNGIPIDRFFFPSLLGEEIEWVSTENESAIVITSSSIANMIEFDIYNKPSMLLLRISYFFLIFSLLWFLLMTIWGKKLTEIFKKPHSPRSQTRPHHTHHHDR